MDTGNEQTGRTYSVTLHEYRDADLIAALADHTSNTSEWLVRIIRIGWQADRDRATFERMADLVRTHTLEQIACIERGEDVPKDRAWSGTHQFIDDELARMRDAGADPRRISGAYRLHDRMDDIVRMCVSPEGIAKAREALE